MGSIYRRGNVWWVKYSQKNGRSVRESSGSHKKKAASRLLIRREYEVEEGLHQAPKKQVAAFEDLVEMFIQDYRLNARRSVERAEQCVSRLNKQFAGYMAGEITTQEIQRYIERRKDENAANASVNRELSALKRMFNLAYRQSPPLVERVPYVPMLKEDNARQGFFENDEFVKVRACLPDYLKGFVTFSYRTGWRLSEIGSLKWSQVDLKNDIVRLDAADAKNGEGRSVYLDAELREVIDWHWQHRGRAKSDLPYVFLNRFGTDRVRRFYKEWKKACKEAGVGIKIIHDFRRTAVRNMVRAGIPEVVAMKISGHKTRAVFDRYNIVNEEDLKQAAQKHSAYLEAQEKGDLGTILGTVTKSGDSDE